MKIAILLIVVFVSAASVSAKIHGDSNEDLLSDLYYLVQKKLGLRRDSVKSEAINWKKVFSPENVKRAYVIYKMMKKAEKNSEKKMIRKLKSLLKKETKKEESKKKKDTKMMRNYNQMSDSGVKMTHSQALAKIQQASVGISSSGGCSDRDNPRCTSLDQVNSGTIDGIVTLKRASGCTIIITGGTETGQFVIT